MVMSGSGDGAGSGSGRSRPPPARACRTRTASRSPGSIWPTPRTMIMSGNNVMNMNGSDASAAAGFNTTTPNWHYTGPAIPQAEANALLTDGHNAPSDIHMAESGCAPSLTAAENIGAVQYVQATSAAVTPFADAGGGDGRWVRARLADGLPGRDVREPDHRGGQRGGEADARSPARRRPRLRDDAVGHRRARGRHVHPSVDRQHGPDALRRARAVASPHAGVRTGHAVARPCPSTSPGFPPCPSGSTVQPTPYVSLVWQVPVAGGPLAIQPPDIQIVEAAVMQQNGTSVASQG